jgi:capsular polysaccharide export protein
VADAEALRHADHVVRGHALPTLLAAVDAVHVLTSLTGFEALLRGREVVTHGQPFYAGWGLTRDLAPPPRRGRPLALAELAAGALILYPRYRDPVTGAMCTPETLVARLAENRRPRPALLPALRRLQAEGRRGLGLRPPAHGAGAMA